MLTRATAVTATALLVWVGVSAMAPILALAGTESAGAGTETSRAKALKVYENRGVGKARLGQKDRYARQRLGMRPTRSGADNEYEGQVVYYFFFGSRNGSGNYELEMYADKRHKVFMFVANGSQYRTGKGIHVGSGESSLVKAYGGSLKRRSGDVVTTYTLGGRRGTDFYVAGGRVNQMVVRQY